MDGQVYYFAIPSPYTSGVEINKTLEEYSGDDNAGSSTITIPTSASTMKWEWMVGRYPEETSYTISYTKLASANFPFEYPIAATLNIDTQSFIRNGGYIISNTSGCGTTLKDYGIM